MRHCLTRPEECRRILEMFTPERSGDIMMMLERQFTVLHNRAQVLLGLCGIVITATGFSGRAIAGADPVGQGLIIFGVTLVLLAAAVTVWGVLHLRWLTMQPGETTEQWLMTSLAYRDRKTHTYRVGIVLMLAGLTLYVAAIAILLLNPTAP